MKQYLIKKGDHYCSMSILEKIGAIGFNAKKYSAKFMMHKECWWATPRNSDDYDQNKLTGIGYGLNHHNNSVRLTWVPDFAINGLIKISGYTYDEKSTTAKYTIKYITSVQVGQIYTATIETKGSQYAISVNGVSILMDNLHPDPNLSFRLYPYFGGNNVAPQNMIIELESNP